MDKLNFYIDGVQSDLFNSGFRTIGWVIIRTLNNLAQETKILVDKMYALLDFTTIVNFQSFFGEGNYQIILTVMLALAIMGLGWTMLFNHEHKPEVFKNIFIFMIVLFGIPFFMNTANQITRDFKTGVEQTNIVINGVSTNSIDDNDKNNVVTTNDIIKNNVVDWLYVTHNGTLTANGTVSGFKAKNNFTERTIDIANITEIINKDNIKLKTKDVETNDRIKVWTGIDNSEEDYLMQYQTFASSTDSPVYQQCDDKTSIGADSNPFYRYTVDWTVIILSLLAIILTYICVAIKVSKLVFELALNGIFVVAFTATDLNTGKRGKEIIKNIISIYCILLIIPIMMKFYFIGGIYISQTLSDSKFVEIFVLIMWSWAIIDGPNIIERVLGIDVGVRSGWQLLMGGFAGARTATSIAKSAGSSVAHVGSSIGSAVGSAVGSSIGSKGSKGIKDAINKNSQKQSITDNKTNIEPTTTNQTTQQNDNSKQPLSGEQTGNAFNNMKDNNQNQTTPEVPTQPNNLTEAGAKNINSTSTLNNPAKDGKITPEMTSKGGNLNGNVKSQYESPTRGISKTSSTLNTTQTTSKGKGQTSYSSSSKGLTENLTNRKFGESPKNNNKKGAKK